MNQCRPQEWRDEAIIVTNGGAGSSTGTARAVLRVPSGMVYVSLALAYVPNRGQGRPSAFTGNTFSIYGRVRDGDGRIVQLSETPINDGGSQQAPGGWWGPTLLDELELVHSFTGLVGTVAGVWKVIARACPAVAMSDELWAQLAAGLSLDINGAVGAAA